MARDRRGLTREPRRRPIGRLDVDPGTRLRLVESREGAHRLALARGRVHALIWAPPGQFVVDTPSSRAVNLGCAYTLDVSRDGRGSIEVSAGWVAFEHDGRESFIPAGARCETRPGSVLVRRTGSTPRQRSSRRCT